MVAMTVTVAVTFTVVFTEHEQSLTQLKMADVMFRAVCLTVSASHYLQQTQESPSHPPVCCFLPMTSAQESRITVQVVFYGYKLCRNWKITRQLHSTSTLYSALGCCPHGNSDVTQLVV